MTIQSRRDVVARLVRTLGANCHAPGFDARRRGTAHPVIKCGTGCWALSPAQVPLVFSTPTCKCLEGFVPKSDDEWKWNRELLDMF
ncbi:hypothetical protein F2Q68_00042539 [Brassica cretica]|uniref:Uncharacterized protein n=1 Tax=Brassica cretica TaxID=69181 RepID=A0A8S9MF04_BRACR|nr:hypothetical protein F2Q68_00042539 [Brassica cretica]